MTKEIIQYLETLVALNQQLLAAMASKEFLPVDEILLDNADVKQMLKISDATLYRLRKNNQLPHQKIGGKWYYSKLALLKLLKEGSQP